jgi:hypothetical protein
MKADVSRYKAALAQIADIASTVSSGEPSGRGAAGGGGTTFQGCSVKVLPARLHAKAALLARRINPVNGPLREPLPGRSVLPQVQRLTLDTGRYWGPASRTLSVSFMESADADLRARIVSHMNAWSVEAGVGIDFTETAGTGQVRISREPGGFFSYLGTDVLLVPPSLQTMNLESFTMGTPESEYRRVVRHETGHTLGFPHEHMRRELVERIDPQKAYPYFLRTQGWDQQTVDEQVLTPLGEADIFGTPPDQDSIMCYQLPGAITFDGRPIRGGVDINATDAAFAASIYPTLPFSPQQAAGDVAEDWPASEDVSVSV